MAKSPQNNLRSPPSNQSPFFQEKLFNRRLTKEFNDLNLDPENLKFQGQANYLISPILKPRPEAVTPTIPLAKIESYEVLINFSNLIEFLIKFSI